MKVVWAGAAGALAIAVSVFGIAEQHPSLDPITVSAFDPTPATDEFFLLQVGGIDRDCHIAAALAEVDKRPLSLDPACTDIVPGLAGTRWWLEREDGSVAFLTDDGRVAAEFAVADGAAFESYAPRQPIMTLLSR